MKQNEKTPLPIDRYLPEILEQLQKNLTLVIKAPPGSGKTTRLPWSIAKHFNKKVAVLEPRRLAAKMAAQRIAQEENINLGRDVGYQFRFEKNATDSTKVTFFTEGTFLRKFLKHSELDEFGYVILDEFHERHLETDLALAFLRSIQKLKKLKIIIMSATLDTHLLENLNESKVIEINAQTYSVEVKYLPNQPSIINSPLEVKVKNAIKASEGDTLVFLPGMKEMLKVESLLADDVEVILLHGSISKSEQEKAFKPTQRRKIILSTNIAESSLTIPGIKTVIDSGIQRQSTYSDWNGLKIIKDFPITQSSAIQRQGRVGRTSSGTCLRLYSEFDFHQREKNTLPEIMTADLTDACLLITQSNLNPLWPTNPETTKWDKALTLLEKLGAFENHQLTKIGKAMLDFPIEARLARVLIAGHELNQKAKEKLIDFICYDLKKELDDQLEKKLNAQIKKDTGTLEDWEKALIYGFIDQVAKFRAKNRDFIHYSGKVFKAHHNLKDLTEGLYIIFDISKSNEAILVKKIDPDWLWELDPIPLSEEDELEVEENFIIKKRVKVGSIVLEEESRKINWNEIQETLKNKVLSICESKLNKQIERLTQTQRFLRLALWYKLQEISIDMLVKKISLLEYFNLVQELDWDGFENYFFQTIEENLNTNELERCLPISCNFGNKKELVIHYDSSMTPFIEAPIQDFYGLTQTPRIYQGRIPLVLKLLGPHKRPIQITKDLKRFWEITYVEIKKEFTRDYPKHHWPEKPWEAKPILLKSKLDRK